MKVEQMENNLEGKSKKSYNELQNSVTTSYLKIYWHLNTSNAYLLLFTVVEIISIV